MARLATVPDSPSATSSPAAGPGVAPLASPPEVAEFLKMSEAALAQMRYSGKGPKFIKVTGRKVRYRWSDVLEWVAAQERTQT